MKNRQKISALAGHKVVITRPREQAGALSSLLREHGAEPLLLPAFELQPILIAPAVLHTVLAQPDLDWIIFTSANAVRFFAGALKNAAEHLPSGIRIAAIGQGTARAAEQAGFTPDFTGRSRNGQEFFAQLLRHAPGTRHVLYPASKAANRSNALAAEQAGVTVSWLELYQPVPALSAPDILMMIQEAPDLLTFFSPSAVQFFLRASETAGVEKTLLPPSVSIGSTTTAALREAGIIPVAEALIPTVHHLVEALVSVVDPEKTY